MECKAALNQPLETVQIQHTGKHCEEKGSHAALPATDLSGHSHSQIFAQCL